MHEQSIARGSRWRSIARGVLATGMISMGVLHFVGVAVFTKAVPDYLPFARELVLVSGVCEIAGGMGLLIPRTRRAAAIGLIALFVAVFPANVGMAFHADHWVAPGYEWVLWLRLPFQLVFILWAWFVGLN